MTVNRSRILSSLLIKQMNLKTESYQLMRTFLLKSQEGIDWRQGKLMILGESTGVYIPEEEAGPCDWGCPCDGDSHADGPVSMGNRMAQVVTCCVPLLPSTPPGLRMCMTSYPSQPQSRLHYSTHVMCHMPWAHDLIT